MKALFYISRFLLLMLVIGITSTGCSDEAAEEPNGNNIDVALEFQKYVDRFIEEGAQRGYEIDFNDTGLSIQFASALPEDAAGVCSELGTGTSGSHEIEIRKTYWETLTDIQKERLIFHELGHCELNRPHDNSVFSNGDWKSIMRGSPLPPDKTPIVNYTGTRRDYYIDELFNPTTPAPTWLNFSVPYNDITADQKNLILSVNDVEEFEEITSLTREVNFEIEVEMEVLAGLSFSGMFWAGPDIPNSLHLYVFDGKEIHIASGSLLFGIMHVFDFPSNIAYRRNKFTIRRVDDFYLLYFNEDFLYWLDYFPLRSSKIGSLNDTSKNDVVFHNVNVYTID
jgi:hypothetical protein